MDKKITKKTAFGATAVAAAAGLVFVGLGGPAMADDSNVTRNQATQTEIPVLLAPQVGDLSILNDGVFKGDVLNGDIGSGNSLGSGNEINAPIGSGNDTAIGSGNDTSISDVVDVSDVGNVSDVVDSTVTDVVDNTVSDVVDGTVSDVIDSVTDVSVEELVDVDGILEDVTGAIGLEGMFD